MHIKPLTIAVLGILGIAIALPSAAATQTTDSKHAQSDINSKIDRMQQQIDALQKQLQALRQAQAQAKAERQRAVKTQEVQVKKVDKLAKAAKKSTEGIKIGGAMRFQYSYEGYNKNNTHRIGDADFDIFRLNMRGKVDNIELQAEWRWFQYMSAVKFAWLGYDFGKHSQVQVGLTRIPFGNQPYNSHNYFFSSNYYLGLEDTYHMGVEYVYSGDSPWNVQLAFFKNDGMGGVDGYVSNRNRSYSYDVVGVRSPGEGTYADPQNPVGSANSVAGRVAYTLRLNDDLKVEFGASGLHGGIRSPSKHVGNYNAYALHMNATWKRWNIQAQASRYKYNVNGATRLAVGAYAFYDSIPAKANSYTFNVRYHQPVSWGPVHSLDFYNDYSLINNKSGMLPNTFMDVLGVGVSAGDLYTYFDFVTGRNQPFIGGTMVGSGKTEHRFNVNFGFYF